MLTSDLELAEEEESKRLATAHELMKRATAMLAWPLERVTTRHERSGLTVTVEPAGWNYQDLIAALTVAGELQGRSVVGLARLDRMREQAQQAGEAAPAEAPQAKPASSRRRAGRQTPGGP